MKRIILWLCTFLIMVGIFLFSNQTSDNSSKVSEGITSFIVKLVNPNFTDLEIITQNEILSTVHLFVRKTAHAFAYFMLGLFIYLSLKSQFEFFRFPVLKTAVLSFILTTIYSISDEIHQLFISGRSGQITDVLIDLSGALIAIIILSIIHKKKTIKDELFN